MPKITFASFRSSQWMSTARLSSCREFAPGPTEHHYTRVVADSNDSPNNNKSLPRNSKRSDTGVCPYGWVFPTLHAKRRAIE